MIHEETSQTKASGVSSEVRRPRPDGEPHSQSLADDYLRPCNKGRFAKKCVPRGYIPDFDWTTIHDEPNQPIKPVKQEKDPNKPTVAPAAPTEVEGPPSSHLRSKTKQ